MTAVEGGLRSTGRSLKLISRGERNTKTRINVTITSYCTVPRSCDHKMKPRIVRQTPFREPWFDSGETFVASASCFNSVTSALMVLLLVCNCARNHTPVQLSSVDRLGKLRVASVRARYDTVDSHVGPQRFRHDHAAVGLLVVLKNRKPSAPYGQCAAVQRVQKA